MTYTVVYIQSEEVALSCSTFNNIGLLPSNLRGDQPQRRRALLSHLDHPKMMITMTNATNCSAPSSEYQAHLYPAVYSLVVALGLPGNLGALYVFIFKITPRTSTNVYIINLALADTAILCTLPFRIHYHLHRNNWEFGDMACRVTGILFHANIYISIFFMSCICVDRYIATVHPHSYLKMRDSCCAVVVSVSTWVLSGVAGLAFIFNGPLDSKSGHAGQRSCFENFTEHEWGTRVGPFSIACLVCGSLLPSVVILVCYPLVGRRISLIRSHTAGKAQRIIYTILAITLLCFLPYHVVHFLHLLHCLGVIQHCSSSNVIYHARRVSMALVSLNPCLDPLLYYVTTSHCKWRPKMRVMWTRNRDFYTVNIS
ncbi:lysophosphatidic acid receptor 6 [Hypomesus transpacificus]|uniref:lysophosphatidic acid receptor 6 n=1 Tax=Hypomesus transpacificus TaxID=137520 RepID=UPI001F086CCE|nr:lysophosphatidic acid receptor 6 [Hypomesus transpacificus]